jgi:tRNA pseudouridine55 synthase
VTRRNVDGILLLDKPKGISSNAALQKAKRLFNASKAGHTGSLDPNASGLLPICFGQATKYSQYLLNADKTYSCEAKLGESTTTGDCEGEIVATHPVHVNQAELNETLNAFRGPQQQVPTMYSALKHLGQPLYKLARRGIEVERQPRDFTVYALDCLVFEPPLICLKVTCSKGTYIRTLVEDIGKRLGCGAHVTELRRLSVGDFPETQLVDFKALEQDMDSFLLPVDAGLMHFERLDLTPDDHLRLIHGKSVSVDSEASDLVRLYTPSGFIGLGQRDQKVLKAKRLLATNAQDANTAATP